MNELQLKTRQLAHLYDIRVILELSNDNTKQKLIETIDLYIADLHKQTKL